MRKLCLSARFPHLWHDTPLTAYDLGFVVCKKCSLPIQDIVIKRKDLLTFAKDIMNGELDFLCSSSKTASSATSSFVKLFQTFQHLSLPDFPGGILFVSKALARKFSIIS